MFILFHTMATSIVSGIKNTLRVPSWNSRWWYHRRLQREWRNKRELYITALVSFFKSTNAQKLACETIKRVIESHCFLVLFFLMTRSCITGSVYDTKGRIATPWRLREICTTKRKLHVHPLEGEGGRKGKLKCWSNRERSGLRTTANHDSVQ